MSVRTEQFSDAFLVYLVGSLELATHAIIRTALGRALQDSQYVVVDMVGVDYIDSGLKTLLRYHEKARNAGGELVLAHPSPIVTHLIEVVNLDHAIRVFKSVEAALS